MDGGIEQTLPPALRGLPVSRVFVDVWDEPRVDDRFAVMPGIKPAIEIEIRAVDFQIRQSGHALQGVQSVRKEHGIRFVHRRYGKRGQHKAVVLDDREDLLALLMFVAGIADAIAPFLATVLVPSPWSTRRLSCFSTARCRTLATNACQSDPSSAHLANTLEIVVSWIASLPWVSCGIGSSNSNFGFPVAPRLLMEVDFA